MYCIYVMYLYITGVSTAGDPTEAMRAVAQIAAEPFAAGNQQTCHIVEHPAGHLSVKKLIANDANRMKDGEKSELLLSTLGLF